MLFYLSNVIEAGRLLAGIPEWLISAHYLAIAVAILALSNKGEFNAQSLQSLFCLPAVFFVSGYFRTFQETAITGISVLAWICLFLVPILALRAGFVVKFK